MPVDAAGVEVGVVDVSAAVDMAEAHHATDATRVATHVGNVATLHVTVNMGADLVMAKGVMAVAVAADTAEEGIILVHAHILHTIQNHRDKHNNIIFVHFT